MLNTKLRVEKSSLWQTLLIVPLIAFSTAMSIPFLDINPTQPLDPTIIILYVITFLVFYKERNLYGSIINTFPINRISFVRNLIVRNLQKMALATLFSIPLSLAIVIKLDYTIENYCFVLVMQTFVFCSSIITDTREKFVKQNKGFTTTPLGFGFIYSILVIAPYPFISGDIKGVVYYLAVIIGLLIYNREFYRDFVKKFNKEHNYDTKN